MKNTSKCVCLFVIATLHDYILGKEYEELRFRRGAPLACGVMGIACSSYFIVVALKYMLHEVSHTHMHTHTHMNTHTHTHTHTHAHHTHIGKFLELLGRVIRPVHHSFTSGPSYCNPGTEGFQYVRIHYT